MATPAHAKFNQSVTFGYEMRVYMWQKTDDNNEANSRMLPQRSLR